MKQSIETLKEESKKYRIQNRSLESEKKQLTDRN